MKFTFYASPDDAHDAQWNPGLHIYYDDEHDMEACYGDAGCNICPFFNLDCNTLLSPFAEPGTSIDVSEETHPEYFI